MAIRRGAADPWLPFCMTKARRRVRLFCFHHSGGGASAFRRWSDDLPEDIEVWPVQLPGRETRLQERPFTRMTPLVQALALALRPHLNQPFAFLGHSMGSYIAFEVARLVRKDVRLEPIHLFVAGHQAPQLGRRLTAVHDAPEDALMERIRLLAGTPDEVLQQRELMQIMLPIIRADLELIETYEYAPQEPLSCPISVFWTRQDFVAGEREANAWSAQTSGAFRMRELEGDHFFVHSARPAIQRAVCDDLKATLGEG